MATKTRAAQAKPAADVPTTFTCAACTKQKPLLKNGVAAYFTAKNEGKLCPSCTAERDEKALQKGGITMGLHRQGDVWWAVSMAGRLRFRLVRDAGQTDAQVVSLPRFLDKDKNLWSGRLYPRSGLAYFQRRDAKPAAPAARPAAAT